MEKHDFVPSWSGHCAICKGAPSTRPDHDSPRARFNAAVHELGLTVDHTTTDGWHRSFTRPDGLHLWRIVDFRLGCGIQTAYAQGSRYVNHKPYFVDGDVLLETQGRNHIISVVEKLDTGAGNAPWLAARKVMTEALPGAESGVSVVDEED